MAISAQVIADSVSPDGVRLTTVQLRYHRYIHGELMTHRMFSRNASSSRAIPVQKMIDQVLMDPATPIHWGKNQSGMRANEELDQERRGQALVEWLNARRAAVEYAQRLMDLGVHKQVANRLLEPFQDIQTIVTATEWDNFFNLRRHADAQPEIHLLADAIYEARLASTPILLPFGAWHLPYVNEVGMIEQMRKWSTARCARVSYLNHDRTNPDPAKDEGLHDMLLSSGHFSPFEHCAMPGDGERFYANFRGWISYRRTLGK